MRDREKELQKQEREKQIRTEASGRIAYYMDKLGLTNKDVGELLGISPEQVRKSISAADKTSTFTLLQIIEFSKYYSISLDDIIKNEKQYAGSYPLADFLHHLFEADKIYPLTVREDDYERFFDQKDSAGRSSLLYEDVPMLFVYDNRELNDILKAWEQLKCLPLPPETREEIITIWQSNTLYKVKAAE